MGATIGNLGIGVLTSSIVHSGARVRTMRTKRNRYYSFRNIERLKSVKRWNALFAFLGFIAGLTIAAGGIAFFIWLILTIFTLGQVPFDNYLTITVGALLSGIGLMALSMILKWIIEFIYMRAERAELKSINEGAEKYFKVMKATNNISKWNLIFIFISLTLAVVFIVSGLNEIVGFATAIISISMWIASRIMLSVCYNKVADEIKEIKEERKANKKAMIE